MKVRAAYIARQGASRPFALSRPIEIADIDLDPPGAGEVLVKVEAAALCHTDLSFVNGDRPRPMPMVLGHEACGEVLECGEGVDDLAAGDRVVFSFVPRCGHCGPCVAGRPVLCEPGGAANAAGTLLSGARRMSCRGEAVNHQAGLSAFCECVVVSRRSLVKVVGEPMRPEHAVLFGCAVLTGGGAVVNTARVEAGATVAVVGLGGVGLAAVMMAAAIGAREIVAIDIAERKLSAARAVGATHGFDAGSESVVSDVRDLTDGGVDYAFEMAGAPGTMELAYALTRRGGTTVTASLPPNDRIWSLPQVSLVGEERTVKGSFFGSSIPDRDVPRFMALFRQGRLPVDKLLTGTLRLDDVNEGFDDLAAGAVTRQVILFDERHRYANPT